MGFLFQAKQQVEEFEGLVGDDGAVDVQPKNRGAEEEEHEEEQQEEGGPPTARGRPKLQWHLANRGGMESPGKGKKNPAHCWRSTAGCPWV